MQAQTQQPQQAAQPTKQTVQHATKQATQQVSKQAPQMTKQTLQMAKPAQQVTKQQAAKCAQQILQEAQAPQTTKPSDIGLWIDNYDDIFSDFDPRPYSERALSDDFLAEARRASRDKVSGQIELKFLITEKARDQKSEALVKRRLRGHFSRHHKMLLSETDKVKKEGRKLLFFGILIMLLATYLLFNFGNDSLIINFLVVMFEPAGWFLFWSGGDKMLFEPRKLQPEIDFYEKMSKSAISFVSFQ